MVESRGRVTGLPQDAGRVAQKLQLGPCGLGFLVRPGLGPAFFLRALTVLDQRAWVSACAVPWMMRGF